MAQDPAFLFYPGDYLRDTQCLSEEAQVAYDRIMCEHMRNICISQERLNFFTKRLNIEQRAEILSVIKIVDGGFEIPWVVESIRKRREYSDSRRKNRSGPKKDIIDTSKSYVPHMENAIENENAIESKLNSALDEIYVEQQKMKWSAIDFDFELKAFTEKVRGSPSHYAGHDTGGIRLAFQSQLRNARPKKLNGITKQKSIDHL